MALRGPYTSTGTFNGKTKYGKSSFGGGNAPTPIMYFSDGKWRLTSQGTTSSWEYSSSDNIADATPWDGESKMSQTWTQNMGVAAATLEFSGTAAVCVSLIL